MTIALPLFSTPRSKKLFIGHFEFFPIWFCDILLKGIWLNHFSIISVIILMTAAENNIKKNRKLHRIFFYFKKVPKNPWKPRNPLQFLYFWLANLMDFSKMFIWKITKNTFFCNLFFTKSVPRHLLSDWCMTYVSWNNFLKFLL
jgi:hypothetical protein